MTKNEVIDLCLEVKNMPFCQLSYKELDGSSATMTLTHQAYQEEMVKDRPWCTPWGEEAWYDDEASEKLQETYYQMAREARVAVREWEAAHSGKIPALARRL